MVLPAPTPPRHHFTHLGFDPSARSNPPFTDFGLFAICNAPASIVLQLYNVVAAVLERPHTAAPPLSLLPAFCAYFAGAVRRTLSATTSPLPPATSVPAALRAVLSPPARLVRHCHAASSPTTASTLPAPAPARVRAATPVPSRLASASTPCVRPVLSPCRCCALSPCAACPLPSHPMPAAFRAPSPRTCPVPLPRCRRAPFPFHHTSHSPPAPLPASPLASTCPLPNVLTPCLPMPGPRHARHTPAHSSPLPPAPAVPSSRPASTRARLRAPSPLTVSAAPPRATVAPSLSNTTLAAPLAPRIPVHDFTSCHAIHWISTLTSAPPCFSATHPVALTPTFVSSPPPSPF
ncbi:hypothetical protein B0H14DRAFT_3430883 [Mycena olivaceomarginata]|nr:hypothetical protein B0H14DRAFT_3430883 [Mycena olivaceomarginata]